MCTYPYCSVFQGKSYVSGAPSGRRGRFIDLGDGYDSDDSFIDNEEAVRSVLPSTFYLSFSYALTKNYLLCLIQFHPMPQSAMSA